MLSGPSDAEFERARERMLEKDLRGRDIKDERVLEAFSRVRRELFVWEIDRGEAYADHPVRIGEGQTISQPYMVALMTQCLGLEGDERVLEIGTGSGYQTAILAELAREVYTMERFESLSSSARRRLQALGYSNIHYRFGDGTLGWPEEAEGDVGGAPFETIVVTAGSPVVPEPLRRQLSPEGRLVIPVGPAREQNLLVITRRADGTFDRRSVCPCVFVRLVGEEGWPEA